VEKKGLSAVIVTTLVILISILLIGILTAFALPFLKDSLGNSGTTTAGFTLRLVALENSILVQQPTTPQHTSYEVRMIVRRDRGVGNLTGFLVRLEDRAGNEYDSVSFNNVALDEFESYSVVFNHTLQSNVSMMTIIPYALIDGKSQLLTNAAVSYGIDYRGRFTGVGTGELLTARAACEDGLDNDNDGFIDLLDAGCGSATDQSEETQCQDGLDNDNDGWVDAVDPGCADEQDDNEVFAGVSQCSDGIDNDNDGLIDGNDPDCGSPLGTSESVPLACSNGIDDDSDGLTDLYDFGCSSSIDNSESNDPPVLVVEQVSDTAWNAAGVNNVERMFGINGNYFDCNHDGVIEVDTLRQCADSSLIPQGQTYIRCSHTGAVIGRCDIPSDVRYIYLDMEVPWSVNLLNQPAGSAAFELAQDQMILAMDTVRAARPGSRVGIYPFPLMPQVLCNPPGSGNCFYHASPGASSVLSYYRNRTLSPTRVFAAVDFTSPDIYENYPTYPTSGPGIVLTTADEVAYARHVVQAAHDGAPTKPVYPYIWQRFNIGPYLYKLISTDEMIHERINGAMAGGANGVIWWGADMYWFSTAYRYASCSSYTDAYLRDTLCPQLRTALDPELSAAGITNASWPGNGAIQSYLDDMHETYLRAIANAL
jgi:hypothetical protein